MKRTLRLTALLLALCLVLTGFPVAASAAEDGLDYADLNAKSVRFQKNKTLIREKDFSVTTKDVRLVNGGYILLELEVHNAGKNAFYCLSDGTVISGYHISQGFYKTVKPGGKETEQLYIDVLPLAAVGLDVLNDIRISFNVINAKTYRPMYEDCSITVPLGIPIEMDYYAYEKSIYEDKNLSLTLLGSARVDRRPFTSFIFRLENHRDNQILAKNDSKFTVDNQEKSFFIYETAERNSDSLFVLSFEDEFFAGKGTRDVELAFPLEIYDENYKSLAEANVCLTIDKDGKIRQLTDTLQNAARAEDEKPQSQSKDASQSENMFLGLAEDYKLVPEYVASLRNKYPDDYKRYSENCFFPYVSELLTLYMDELDKAGFDFGTIERTDLCTEHSYVLELTDDGESVIQVAFTQVEYDPKAAYIMTLGCAMDLEDLDKTNSYLEAMWLAYEMLNVELTEEERANVIQNGETSVDERYGVLMRGQFHGLGYVQATNDKETYLTISPDLSLPVFKGLK